MLVLTRKVGGEQWIQIGPDIQVRVISSRKEKGEVLVRVGIDAPKSVQVLRGPELVNEDGTPKPAAGGG